MESFREAKIPGTGDFCFPTWTTVLFEAASTMGFSIDTQHLLEKEF